MRQIVLAYPNGQRQDVYVADVPREGEAIRLTNGVTEPSLLVEHVLWMEAIAPDQEPVVICIVRERDDEDENEEPWTTMVRDWLTALVVPLIIVVALFSSSWIGKQLSENQLAVACQSAQSNLAQLTALREIADQLGVPVTFKIPEVPPECDGS